MEVLFEKGIPGFEEHRHFNISIIDENSKFYEIVSKEKSYFAYNEAEKAKIIDSLGKAKYTIHRSKGLGENEPDMMWLTTMNPETRRLIKVMPEDAQRMAEIFDLLLGDNLEGRKVGVIQNEFGKLSIDGALVNRNGIQMTEISRGSIFCSCLKGTFAQALAEMGKMNLEYVFVESSGLADPSNIEEILAEVTAMAGEVYDFRGVICLIDGVNFLEQLSDVETVDRQLAHCHMAVINKMDLIDEGQLAKVTDAIRQVNPICHVITSRFGLIDLDFLDMDLSALQWAPCEDSHNTVDNKPKTISLESEAVLSREVLTAFLQAVLPDCYRIKGFFHLEEGWQQVDVVEKLIDFKPCQERELSQLVFLSKIGPKVIRTIDSAWKEIVKQPMKLKN